MILGTIVLIQKIIFISKMMKQLKNISIGTMMFTFLMFRPKHYTLFTQIFNFYFRI